MKQLAFSKKNNLKTVLLCSTLLASHSLVNANPLQCALSATTGAHCALVRRAAQQVAARRRLPAPSVRRFTSTSPSEPTKGQASDRVLSFAIYGASGLLAVLTGVTINHLIPSPVDARDAKGVTP